jgi:drug/metabolite transporter (DMT)-like permease
VSRTLANVALLGVTAVWGWTFVVVHEAIAIYGVLAFLAARFGLAAAAGGLIWGHRLDRRNLRIGAGIGLVLAMGYLFQTWGLRHTTPTNSGLITGLFVVFARSPTACSAATFSASMARGRAQPGRDVL